MMKMKGMWLAVALALAVAAMQSAAPAQPVRVAAYVVGFDRPLAAYGISRAMRPPVQLVFNQSLVNGDVIMVRDPSATLMIRYVDRRVVIVNARMSPYRVWSDASEPSVAGNTRRSVWDGVTRAADSGMRSTNTRGDDGTPLRLLIPGLSNGRARIASGARHFGLEWRGGEGPFRLVVSTGSGTVLADEVNIATRGVTIARRFVQFGEGNFIVTLTDGKGATATGRFSAASSGLPPAPDPTSVPASFDGAARDVMTCGAMVEADRSQFALEAYQCAFDAAQSGWQPAIELRRWIGEGALDD